MRYLDLTKIDSIHNFSEGLKKDGIRLDITILNAGVTPAKARKTASGLDEMFLVNYLANVMLTNLLMTSGVISYHNNSGINNHSFKPRVIFISSDSHQGSSYVDYNEFGRYFDYGVSKAIANYSYFKLVLNTYATELSRKANKDGFKTGINIICP